LIGTRENARVSLDQTASTPISLSVMRMLFTDDGRPPRDRSLIVPKSDHGAALRARRSAPLLMVVAAEHEVHVHLGKRATKPLAFFNP
jgi:hypothetical protein